MFQAEGLVMRGKTVIITGANAGIGFETTSALAKFGAKVIMACRSKDRAEAARNKIIERLKPEQADVEQRLIIKQLELSSLKSVRAFADDILKSESRLDVLINNAGIGGNPEKVLTEDGLELAMATNHFGHFLLTNLLLPLLKSSAPSRIVVLSSSQHARVSTLDFDNLKCEKEYDPRNVYNTTKVANLYFTRQLAKRLEGTNVIVNAVHPGLVDTEIFKHVRWPGKFFLSIAMLILGKTPVQGAQTSIYLAASDAPEALVSGRYFADMKEEKMSELAQNEENAVRFWEISERVTGLQSA